MKINIREIRESDMWTLHRWINDPEIIKFTNGFRPISEMEQREWINNTAYFKNNYVFGIEDSDDDKLLGTCGLYDCDFVARKAELRMKIGDKSYHGKGIGTKALKLLLHFGYQDVNLNKIWLKVLYNNKAAVKLYRNERFVEEGILRQDMYIKGDYHDVYIMSLLKQEYIKDF